MVDLALKGDMTGVSPGVETAGDGGILELGNELDTTGGADRGPGANGLAGILVFPLGDLWTCSHSHEQSVASLVAVEGPLSSSFSSRARSESSDPALACELTLDVEPAVDVRLSACLPVDSGLATLGLKAGLVKAGLVANVRKSM